MMYDDGSYRRLHPQWHRERARWKAEQIAGLIRSTLPERSWGSIVDIGCGTGDVLGTLAPILGAEIAHGVEPSPDVPALTAHGVERWKDIEALPRDRYDMALLLDVVEHVERPYDLVRQTMSLAPIVVFHIPLDASALGIIRSDLMSARTAHGHVHNHTAATARAFVNECGLEILGDCYTPAGFDGPGRARRPIDVVRAGSFRVSPSRTAQVLGGVSLAVVANGVRSEPTA